MVHSKFFLILFALLCVFVITACVWAPAPGAVPNVSSSGGVMTDESGISLSESARPEWSCQQ